MDYSAALDAFEKKGWALLPEVLPRKDALQYAAEVLEPLVPSTASSTHAREQFFSCGVPYRGSTDLLTKAPRLRAALDDLHAKSFKCKYRVTGSNLDLLHCRRPEGIERGMATPKFFAPWSGWHVDRNAIDGDQSLTAVVLVHFSDVTSGGGGTAVQFHLRKSCCAKL